MTEHSDLSSSELRRRLEQRGWGDAEAARLVADRDDPRVMAAIERALVGQEAPR